MMKPLNTLFAFFFCSLTFVSIAFPVDSSFYTRSSHILFTLNIVSQTAASCQHGLREKFYPGVRRSIPGPRNRLTIGSTPKFSNFFIFALTTGLKLH